MMNKITKIIAEEIKDSRGNPTIKVSVFVDNTFNNFSVPAGASTGVHEAHELRDADGMGVKNAIDKVNNTIAPMLLGQDVLNQKEIDRIMIELDGTPNKDNLGGNSMIGVSVACAKTAAKVLNIEVFQHLRTLAEMKPSRKAPYLYMNLINGGKHAQNGLAFQEYQIVPDTEDIALAIDIGVKIQNTLNGIIIRDFDERSLILGDEGGFALRTGDIKRPLLSLSEAIKQNNLEGKVRLSLDVAASSFYKDGIYTIDGKSISKEELLSIYGELFKEFDIFSIEDPFQEEDFESFKKLKNSIEKLKIVGDDLTVTNKVLLQKAITEDSINTMIIKPNQIGTLSETLETMKLARDNNIELIVSHRSGETDDDFIADLAFAFNCFGLKAGSPAKIERMLKYKRLTKIINLLLK